MCEFHESTCNGFGDIWWTDNPIYLSSIDFFILLCNPWQVGFTGADKFGRDVTVNFLLDCFLEVLPHFVDVRMCMHTGVHTCINYKHRRFYGTLVLQEITLQRSFTI